MNVRINKHAIKLIEVKQCLYEPLYALSLVKFKTLKIYIKTYLKTGFIWPSKYPAEALILFDKKPNGSLQLCVNNQGLNNFAIKNFYLFPLIW